MFLITFGISRIMPDFLHFALVTAENKVMKLTHVCFPFKHHVTLMNS